MATATAERRVRNRQIVDEVRSRTVCVLCGAQPIDWHRPEHDEHPDWRVPYLVSHPNSVERILAEIEACTPLCRRCHMTEDGRMERWQERNRSRKGSRKAPKPCAKCSVPTNPARRGMCRRCYDAARSARKVG